METIAPSGNNRNELILRILLGVFVLCLLSFLVKVRSTFPLLEYPWLFPDSFDWIWNAFSYSQEKTLDVTHRGMLFSLLGGFCFRLGIENALSLFGTLAYLLVVVATYIGGKRIFGFETGFFAATLLASSSNLIDQSAYVGCDVMALAFLSAFFFAYFCFLRNGSLQAFGLAAIFAVLCFHTQYVIVLASPSVLLAWFLSLDPKERLFTLQRFGLLMKSPGRILRYGIAAGVLFSLFLAPRVAYHHLIYTEKVEHASLVELRWNIPYYAVGLLSTLSWPVVLFAGLGLIIGIAKSETRRQSLFLFGWFANIFLFFGLLYSWKDVRFLIYLFPPVFLFCGLAIQKFGSLFLEGNRTFVPRFVRALLLMILILASQLRAGASAFDNIFYLTPSLAYEYLPDDSLKSEEKNLNFTIFEEERFANGFRNNLADNDIDGVNVSEPMARLLSSLRRNSVLRDLPIVVYEKLGPADLYVTRNRNRLYARFPVVTVPSPENVLELLKRGRFILVLREIDVETIRSALGQGRIFAKRLGHEGSWLAGLVVPTEAGSEERSEESSTGQTRN